MGTFPMVNGTTINLFLYKNKQFPTSLSSSSHDVKEPFLIKLEKGKKKTKTYSTMCQKCHQQCNSSYMYQTMFSIVCDVDLFLVEIN